MTPIKNAKDLGSLIRTRRKEKGLTQVRLAILTGTSPRFIGEVERGRSTAGFGLVLHVLSTLGLDTFVSARGAGSKVDRLPSRRIIVAAD